MKIKRLIFILFLCGKLIASSFSERYIGTTASSFLKISPSPAGIALAGAYSSFGGPLKGLYYNSALLVNLNSPEVFLSYTSLYQDMGLSYVVLSRPVYFLKGTVAFTFEQFWYGSIKKVSNSGQELGSFSPSSSFYAFSYARSLFGINTGLTVKRIIEKISDKSASAIAFDFGLCKSFNEKFNLAFSVKDFGTKLKFNKIKDSLPFSIRIGASYKFFGKFIFAFDSVLPSDNKSYFNFGGEYLLSAYNFKSSIRAGYSTVNALGNFSFGFGIKRGKYSIDYAYQPFGILGIAHRISLNIDF